MRYASFSVEDAATPFIRPASHPKRSRTIRLKDVVAKTGITIVATCVVFAIVFMLFFRYVGPDTNLRSMSNQRVTTTSFHQSSNFAVPCKWRLQPRRGSLLSRAEEKGMSFDNLEDLKAFGNMFDDYKSVVNAGIKSSDLKASLDSGFEILDIRPDYEYERIHPSKCVHVPFIKEENMDGGINSIINKWKNTVASKEDTDMFVDAVRKRYRIKGSSAKLVVACGEGPRSLLATYALNEAGFKDAKWLAGGFISVPEGVIKSEVM